MEEEPPHTSHHGAREISIRKNKEHKKAKSFIWMREREREREREPERTKEVSLDLFQVRMQWSTYQHLSITWFISGASRCLANEVYSIARVKRNVATICTRSSCINMMSRANTIKTTISTWNIILSVSIVVLILRREVILKLKRLMKRWKHSGGNVINAGQVNLMSTWCRYQTRHNSMN